MSGGGLLSWGPRGGWRAGAFARASEETGRKNLMLLIHLRWLAVVGQLVTLLLVRSSLALDLPVATMAMVLAAQVGLNLLSLLRLWHPAGVRPGELLVALLFDVLALTVQLYLTGGAGNPFVFLYLLQVTLGAVLLDIQAGWAIALVTGLCFAGLTVLFRPLSQLGQPFDMTALRIEGLLVCFALDAALLVFCLTRVIHNIEERDAHLAAMREREAEEDHVVRMGLLASGAAHELGTPLATLSVILGDWRRMPALERDVELAEDLDQMEAEVQRCKAIVTGILLSTGEARSESASPTSLPDFLDELVADWRGSRNPAHLSYGATLTADVAIVSDASLRQVIFNVLDNALEASPAWVGLSAEVEGACLVIAVTDKGAGFAPDILKEIGRPYQSTKGERGNGLGLFLAVNVLRKLGGRMVADNRAEGGAIVTLTLPLEALAVGPA